MWHHSIYFSLILPPDTSDNRLQTPVSDSIQDKLKGSLFCIFCFSFPLNDNFVGIFSSVSFTKMQTSPSYFLGVPSQHTHLKIITPACVVCPCFNNIVNTIVWMLFCHNVEPLRRTARINHPA